MNYFTNSDGSLQFDFYSILGCSESSTVSAAAHSHILLKKIVSILNGYLNYQQVDQIMAEYKHRALLCHPDKHPGDDGSQMKKFQELQVGSSSRHFILFI